MEKGPVLLEHGIKITGFRKIPNFLRLDHVFLVTILAIDF